MIDIRVPQNGNTFYGDKIVSLRDMVSDSDIEQAIKIGLNSVFGGIDLSEELLSGTIHCCVNSAKHCLNLLNYERSIHSFLDQKMILEKYNASKNNRASMRIERVERRLVGKTVLDLGCGSGKIGLAIKNKGYEVILADVYKSDGISASGLPFSQIIDGESLPFNDNSFDNVMILSMLHHTQNPPHTIDECKRILRRGGRLHLIETVYGIRTDETKGSYGTEDAYFRSLSDEQQRQVTMFFDYFANHVLDCYTEDQNKYIPVPFNFTTPANLERIFHEKGFALVAKEHLGIYPFSYVYHVHFTYGKS